MLAKMIALSTGIASVAYFPALSLPLFYYSIASVIGVTILLLALSENDRFKRSLIIAQCLLLGLCWGQFYGFGVLSRILPEAYESVPLRVTGKVIGLPETLASGVTGEQLEQQQDHRQHAQRFELAVNTVECQIQQVASCPNLNKLRLTWYGQTDLVPGQQWQLLVKLKRPRGLANPGGFDYQTWLTQRGVSAVGYVLTEPEHQASSIDTWSVDHIRWKVSSYLDEAIGDLAYRPLLKALLIADQRDISAQLWDVFRDTGTIHLMVISGLHVGLVSAFAFGLLRYLLLLLVPQFPTERVAAVGSLTVALFYSLAAGFSLPTQRAVLMLAVVLYAIYSRRQLSAISGLTMALLLCLIVDPLCVVSQSFWLSFAAVSVLIFGFAGRITVKAGTKLFKAQALIFVGMLPVMAVIIGQVSVFAPLVNLFVVPIFSLLIVPINLLALMISSVCLEMGQWLWQSLNLVLEWVIRSLFWVEQVQGDMLWSFSERPLVVYLLAGLAALIVLLPVGIPARGMSLLLFAPLVLAKPQPMAEGDLSVTVLDVGQGLSIVVETQHHSLVYDLGAAWDEQFAMSEAAVLPYLQHRGITKLDRLIISHGDNDHAGAWPMFVQSTQPGSILVGHWLPGLPVNAGLCSTVTDWEWDAVRFEILTVQSAHLTHNSNNQSCILKISTSEFSVLLTGDIEEAIELALYQQWQSALPATVLIAPHHGSLSSSSWPLIKTVRPKHTVFSSGYKNAFGHPHPEVVKRYQLLGSQLHSTSEHGAIRFRVIDHKLSAPTHFRQEKQRYWLQ